MKKFIIIMGAVLVICVVASKVGPVLAEKLETAINNAVENQIEQMFNMAY